MIRRSVAVFTAILAMTLASGVAAVQAAPAFKSNATKDQIADAKLQVAAAHLSCDAAEINYIGEGKIKVEGKEISAAAYEITCTGGPGYIVQGVKGGSAQSTATSCIAMNNAYANAKDKKTVHLCEIPANKDYVGGGQVFAQRAGLSACKVDQVSFLGTRAVTRDSYYEVSCGAAGGGYVLDVVGSVGDKVEATNCLKAARTGLTCKLTPLAAQSAPIVALAAQSGKTCKVSDSRYVVGDPKTSLDYYEIACSGAPGYMLAVDPAGALKNTIDCGTAGWIAGGCTLTDAKVTQASVDSSFSARLKSAGVSCDYQKARLIGRDTRYHRDVVEYACAERPTGLIVAFASAEGGKLEVLDCVAAPHFSTTCQFTDKAAIMTQMSKALAAGGKTCKVSDYLYIGAVEAATFDLEVACDGAPGLVVEMPADYSKVKVAHGCALAAKQGVPCTLAGNK